MASTRASYPSPTGLPVMVTCGPLRSTIVSHGSLAAVAPPWSAARAVSRWRPSARPAVLWRSRSDRAQLPDGQVHVLRSSVRPAPPTWTMSSPVIVTPERWRLAASSSGLAL